MRKRIKAGALAALIFVSGASYGFASLSLPWLGQFPQKLPILPSYEIHLKSSQIPAEISRSESQLLNYRACPSATLKRKLNINHSAGTVMASNKYINSLLMESHGWRKIQASA